MSGYFSTPVPLHRRVFPLLLLWLAGCQFYHPLPLTDQAVGAALRKPADSALRIAASEVHHPLLPPVELNLADGLSPSEAAILAVILNPALRAARDARGVSSAQLLQAGLLPNPQLTGNLDSVTGGNSAGTVSGRGFGLTWDVKSLLAHGAKVSAAKSDRQSVDLDLAWQEWQIALEAETALYDVVALRAQLVLAREIEDRQQTSFQAMKKAAATQEKSEIELGAAETTANDAEAARLAIERDLAQRALDLRKVLGLAPDAKIEPAKSLRLPVHLKTPGSETLLTDLENRRLDLLALRRGYESQDANLRVAILEQFPGISFGLNRASDTSNVHTFGPALTLDLPIFDRNQGQIALAQATRQKLFDEFTNRVFEARAEVASALTDSTALEKQITAAGHALPALERLVASYQTASESGGVDLLSQHAAIGALDQKKLEILKLRQELMQTRLKLETATGQFLP